MQITYQPAVGPAVPVSGIFDAQYRLLQGHGGDQLSGVEATAPAVFLRLSSLPVDPELDEPTLIIGGVVYGVIERRTAGLGAIVLVLRKVT